MTDSTPDAESPVPRRRGLWAMMGQTASPEEVVAVESPVAPVEESPIEEAPSAQSEVEEATPYATTPGRRGLWSLMRQTPTEPSSEPVADSETVSVPAEVSETPEPSTPVIASQGLFSLMQRTASGEIPPTDFERHTVDDSQSTSVAEPRDAPHERTQSPADDDLESSALCPPHSVQSRLTRTLSPEDEEIDDDEDQNEEDERLVSPLAPLPIDPDDLEPPRYLRMASQAKRQSWIGLGCGVAAVAASALAMLPQVWLGFPATGFGFAAIIAGYATLTGAGRQNMATLTRAVSVVAMGLGTLGIFLGPLLFSGLGRELREATGQRATSRHLEQMGTALDRYHDQHMAFPVGGIFSRDAAGVLKGQHGWMTFLLPFVGEQELYQSIVQGKPYDDPVNRVAMGRDVATYFAAGGDRAKIGQGFSISHFAGVGGEIDDATGLSHVGVFQRDEAVKKEEVTDGLSNTLIAGELAGTYPPWGDPENWRTIGRGLNKDVNGFGSATGNGATFLLGDGSVRFFNNKTDPKLLIKLSTRDGGE